MLFKCLFALRLLLLTHCIAIHLTISNVEIAYNQRFHVGRSKLTNVLASPGQCQWLDSVQLVHLSSLSLPTKLVGAILSSNLKRHDSITGYLQLRLTGQFRVTGR